MTKSARLKLNLFLLIVTSALVLLALAGIIINLLGFRYIKTDNGTKFYGKTSGGVVVSGTIIYPDGMHAEIDRKAGTILYENGDSYYGEFSGIYRHGNGTMKFAATGDTYEGNFENDIINGKGVYKTSQGDIYEGDFVNGKKQGFGFYVWSDGSSYEGDFDNNRKHGVGTYKYSDGRVYTGDFFEDKKHGKGTFTYANGDKYVGDFVNDKREGTGVYTYANGESYTGEYADNMKNGEGEYKWTEPAERTYKGTFADGEIDMSEKSEDEPSEDAE